ncbi:S24 family peptidase [Aliarcobacter butzleri]|uniref:S24 family peptidase n=1 Tax=Aliarcobacter butzleri TaxID=28197 RepID=UPI003AFA4888
MNTIKLEYHYLVNNEVIKKELEFEENLIKIPFSKSSLFVSKVEGKSMQPLIMDNALVVADLSQKDFENESIFLIYKDENMWLKKGIIINSNEFFISINPDFSHLTFKREDCRIIAKVLVYFNNFVIC